MLRPNYNFEEFIDPGYTTFTTGIESNKKDVCISLKTPKDYEMSGLDYSSFDARTGIFLHRILPGCGINIILSVASALQDAGAI